MRDLCVSENAPEGLSLPSSDQYPSQAGGAVLPVVFSLMVLFIQEGISYYASVQTAALLFLIAVILHTGITVRVTPIVLAVYMLFSGLLLGTAALLPDTISQNSPNILVTTVGVLGYVALILAMVTLRPLSANWLLLFYRRSAAVIIVAIVALVAVTDLGLIPGLTREYLIYQNVDLITNYTTMDVLKDDFATRKAMNVKSDIDLFYGEQSFLSLILFVSLVSHMISSRALESGRSWSSKQSGLSGIRGVSVPLLFCALACMIYIQSFSSLFFAAIVCGFLLVNVLARPEAIKFTSLKIAALLVLLAAASWVAVETAPYYLHRLTTFSDSLSAQQRFGVVLGFQPHDFLLGLHERDRMPAFGFQNGLIYIVMMAGIGGACLLAYLIYRIVRLATPLGLATLCTLAVLAVFSQNGAILSPNKLVVLSFLLLPLVCAKCSKSKESQKPDSARARDAICAEGTDSRGIYRQNGIHMSGSLID